MREDLECKQSRGPDSSISIHGNLLVVPFDGCDHQFVVAFDKRTGKEFRPVIHGGMNVYFLPLFSNGRLYIIISSPSKLLAIGPDGNGDITKSRVEWSTRQGVPVWPAQLLIGDSMFLVDNCGVASCIDITTGKVRWTKQISGKLPHRRS